MKRKDILPVFTVPKCFPNKRHFAIWQHAARITGGCFEVGFCTDCTATYQQRMRLENRCAHPDVVFAPDEHGMIQGTLQLPIQE